MADTDAPAVTLTPGGLVFVNDKTAGGLRATLTLVSQDDRVLLYKLKTSAPAKYKVSPSTGRLLPREKRHIQVRPQVAQLDDRFQMEVRTVSREEEALLTGEKEEKDEIAKMWKTLPEGVPKPVQFLLHTFSEDRTASCPEVAHPKGSSRSSRATPRPTDTMQTAWPTTGAPAQASASAQKRELLKLKEEEEQLLARKTSINNTNSTLAHGESARAGELKKGEKIPKLPPLSMPVLLACVHFTFAFVLGRAVYYLATSLPEDFNEYIVLNPTFGDYLAFVSSFLG
eukprot:TRINITY_DN25479_c0_g1_i1.p1 TRINITY_DN25479_c0_g1~~TRINITY_DN25479_c0_g1_i1.p1  ORF type:complete len:316 (+),score=75.22 TRINITY_DN25479_c0_g1_i1:94-948(+)